MLNSTFLRLHFRCKLRLRFGVYTDQLFRMDTGDIAPTLVSMQILDSRPQDSNLGPSEWQPKQDSSATATSLNYFLHCIWRGLKCDSSAANCLLNIRFWIRTKTPLNASLRIGQMSELLVTSYSEISAESMSLQPQSTPELPCERYSNTFHASDTL
jgi:hypothetical protein